MKVIEFIKRLEEIGYNENTELTFGCYDGTTGEFYYLNLDAEDGDGFSYGEDLDGYPYNNKEINIEIDVDGCKEYVESKQYLANEILDMIVATIDNYNMIHRK